jgi:hypothetical protein
MNYKKLFVLLGMVSFSALAQENLQQLRVVLQSQLDSSLPITHVPIEEKTATITTNKSTSITEVLHLLDSCYQDQITFNRIENESGILFAFSCRKDNSEIVSAEATMIKNGEELSLIDYRELVLEERPLTPSEVSWIIVNRKIDTTRTTQRVSAGLSTLLTLGQVGVPVALSFKYAKFLIPDSIVGPDREEWRLHIIAGAIVSGATILTTEGLLRHYSKEQGKNWSNSKIKLISSLTGLIASMGAGVAKEVKDYFAYGRPDYLDVLATMAGGMVVSTSVAIPAVIFSPRKKNVVDPMLK